MTVNLSGSLMGLSLLTGDSSVFTTAFTPIAFDSKAVRAAKAQFTTAATTPPWKEATATKSASSQLIVDPCLEDGHRQDEHSNGT
jgi:hypothetical protein